MGFWRRVFKAITGQSDVPRSQPSTPAGEEFLPAWSPAGPWGDREAELFERMARELNPAIDPVLEGLYYKAYVAPKRIVTTEQRRRARDEIQDYVFRQYGVDWDHEHFDWNEWRATAGAES